MIAPLSQGTSILRLVPTSFESHNDEESHFPPTTITTNKSKVHTSPAELEHDSTKPDEDQEACHWTDWL